MAKEKKQKRPQVVKLDEDNLRWFRETYPDASINWFLNLLLGTARELHRGNVTIATMKVDIAAVVLESDLPP